MQIGFVGLGKMGANMVQRLRTGGHDVIGYEGRWTVEAAIANAVPTRAISAALYARFSSRQEQSPAMKLVAALRREFGGHDVRERLAPAGEADEPAPSITPPASNHDRPASPGQ